jgi:hypothetical protein
MAGEPAYPGHRRINLVAMVMSLPLGRFVFVVVDRN